MVVIFLAPMLPTLRWQERTGLPSIKTVQAPQSPSPHPYLAPARSRSSRSTLSRVRSASASIATARPFTCSSLIFGIRVCFLLPRHHSLRGSISPHRFPIVRLPVAGAEVIHLHLALHLVSHHLAMIFRDRFLVA